MKRGPGREMVAASNARVLQTALSLLVALPQSLIYQHRRCGYIREKRKVATLATRELRVVQRDDFFKFDVLKEACLMQEGITTTERSSGFRGLGGGAYQQAFAEVINDALLADFTGTFCRRLSKIEDLRYNCQENHKQLR